MVSKRSEYQRQYRKTLLKKETPDYRDHLSYRLSRRDREHSHTPISWDWESPDTESSGEECDNVDIESPISELKIEEEGAELEKDVEDDRTKDDDQVKEGEDGSDRNKAGNRKGEIGEKRLDKDKQVLKAELRKSATEKLDKYSSEENRDCLAPSKSLEKVAPTKEKSVLKPKKVDCKTFVVKKTQPRKVDQRRKTLKLRPASAPVSKPSAVSVHGDGQPVALYGCGNSERTTGQLRTHNVRASSSIYPAALRAYKRKEADIKKRAAEQKGQPLKDKRKRALFNDIMARETGSWDTEYRRNYPCYESTEYARCLSAQLPRKAAGFFVHV